MFRLFFAYPQASRSLTESIRQRAVGKLVPVPIPDGPAQSGRKAGAGSQRAVDAEQIRLVERRHLAAAVDRELQSACRFEAAARRAFGVIAGEMLRRRAYQRLGFVRLGDYTRERLGISARTVESAAWVASRLDELLRIASAFVDGALSWTQVRLLCDVARPDDEARWLERARGITIEDLRTLIEAGRDPNRRSAAPDPEDDQIEGEPVVPLRLACPVRVRALWRHALELARRVASEPLPTWRAMEYIAAEGIAGRPNGTPVGDRALLAMIRLARRMRRKPPGDGERQAPAPPVSFDGGLAAPSLSRLIGVTAGADETSSGDRADLARSDAFALDRRLRTAVGAIGQAEPRIGRLLRILVDHHLHRTFGFPSTESYVRERLGISPRKAWALLKIEKTAVRADPFAAAYREGRLSWIRALTLLPVVDRHTAADWIARANVVTVRRLTDEVNWVLAARDAGGPDVPLVPPPLDGVLIAPWVGDRPPAKARATGNPTPPPDGRCREMSLRGGLQIGAPRFVHGAWAHNVIGAAPAAEVANVEICFNGPASVVALFRDALDAFTRSGEPRWTAMLRLLTSVVADWESTPRHRDPIFARDGWRCTVPACSARRELHDHHLRFRSHGGANDAANRTAVCAAHHLHGIHTGVIRCWGTAPDAIHWELGVRCGAPPLLSYVGDRLNA